jgi:hypothetical protein
MQRRAFLGRAFFSDYSNPTSYFHQNLIKHVPPQINISMPAAYRSRNSAVMFIYLGADMFDLQLKNLSLVSRSVYVYNMYIKCPCGEREHCEHAR